MNKKEIGIIATEEQKAFCSSKNLDKRHVIFMTLP